MKLIIARNAVGNIDFPTSLPDRQRYQALTVGNVCVYGKTTWDTLPAAARRNRESIIVRSSRTEAFSAPVPVEGGCYYTNTFRDVHSALRARSDVWICGGKMLYDAALAGGGVSHIYLSTFADTGGSLRVDLPIVSPVSPKWERLCFQSYDDHIFEIFRKKP